MAPKAKAPPPPPPPPPRGVSPAVKWALLTAFGLICFSVFVGMVVFYIMLSRSTTNPLEAPMLKLRDTIAEGIRNKQFVYATPPKIADEVIQLPSHMEDATLSFEDRKGKYQELFKKRARSSDAWLLFEKSLYYISNEKKTWYDAENFCKTRDSHLASVLSDKEQDYITSQLDEPAWIGFSDENKEGKWEWTDGSRVLSEFWALDNPSHSENDNAGNTDYDCAFLEPMSSSTQNWNSVNCEELHRWVCKESLEVAAP